MAFYYSITLKSAKISIEKMALNVIFYRIYDISTGVPMYIIHSCVAAMSMEVRYSYFYTTQLGFIHFFLLIFKEIKIKIKSPISIFLFTIMK